MDKELDDKLCKKYPKIFVDRNKDKKETAMFWGFEHGNGWYWLLDQLCNNIQGYIDNNKHLKIPQVAADQIKEKFGSLHFYYSGGDGLIREMVWFAESLSIGVCEDCGRHQESTIRDVGWIYNMCDICWKKFKSKKRWLKLKRNIVHLIKHKTQ